MRCALVIAALAAITAAGCGAGDSQPEPADEETAMSEQSEAAPGREVLTGTQPLLNGDPQRLSEYRGEVVMVVNTASECGFTPQFGALEELYREKRSDGFVILGFPADDVAGQEPLSDEEIAKFCEANFGVSFPMFAKTKVVGEEANPVFRALAAEAGEPTWNFNKYLLDRRGRVVARYDASDAPNDPELLERLDALLAERT
jgi:glutathione peroxidase